VKREERMAFFHVYGDESGKMSGNADRTSFCGYVGHISQWERFSAGWNNVRIRYQVPAIHMARIAHPESKDDDWKKVKEKWGDAWDAISKRMLGELGEMVRESGIVCIGAVVDSKHFRLLADTYPLFKKAHRDPVHMAFHTFIMRAIDKTEVIDKTSRIGIVIDNDREFAMACYKQLESLKSLADNDQKFARVKERVHAITFANDASYPGVQAADMIAYEARRIMVERMKDPKATSDLYEDLTFLGMHEPGYYTAEILDQLQASNPVKEDTPDE
jgi:uncharacterized protein DUF3800